MIDWFAFQTAVTAPGALALPGERFAPLAPELTKPQAKGCRALVDEFGRQDLKDIRWLAYILATVFYETGGTMLPQSEDIEAAARQPYGVWVAPDGEEVQGLLVWYDTDPDDGTQTRRQRPSGIPVPVGTPIVPGATTLPEGQTAVCYYGRGYLPRHLVSRRVYRNLSRDAGIDLVSDPDVLVQPEIAAKAAIAAMVKGTFSSLGLARFFPIGKPMDNGLEADWYDARQSVGGVDDADRIAATARGFHAALVAAT